MARQGEAIFVEEWLRSNGGGGGGRAGVSASSSARGILQAWGILRKCLETRSFESEHLRSLETLVSSKSSLHVADPQAKLLLSILSSPSLSLSYHSYPLFFSLLYIWVRKSTKSSSSTLIDSAIHIITSLFQSNNNNSSSLIILLGAFSCSPTASPASKTLCFQCLSNLLEQQHYPPSASILAGIGYALSSSSSDDVYFVRFLVALFGIWGKEGSPPAPAPAPADVSIGLMLLHLIEWLFEGFIILKSFKRIDVFGTHVFHNSYPNYTPFPLIMASAGVLRAFNRFQVDSRVRLSAEDKLDSIARDLISKPNFVIGAHSPNPLLLQSISVALARSGPVSFRDSVLICLTSALLNQVFPLASFYKNVFDCSNGYSSIFGINEVREHLGSICFKEAGAIMGVLCNQYASADEESKGLVEKLIWGYCGQIYMRHRQVALLLRGSEDELLGDLEKIAESAFLMVAVFALAVTKHRLFSKLNREAQMDNSVRILVSFSCVEYFRRIRLPEYMDAIRGAVVSVQENSAACVSFVESMPSYGELMNQQVGSLCLQKSVEYDWSEDEVQTARILFYLRVIPTCIERLPAAVFRKLVAPTIFLYMGHPNGKVARASHSVFVAFISSGSNYDEDNEDERALLKEQLVFYYMQRSLEGYPGTTPFDGMASGVAALVRHLPAGSPAILYCIHTLVERADKLRTEVTTQGTDMWKSWQGGESEPSKKILELLLRLISLVDIQVLPRLMKLLAQLVVDIPKDGQNMVLNEIYSLVAESDDVTRKLPLVSWLQSLSYLSSKTEVGGLHARL